MGYQPYAGAPAVVPPEVQSIKSMLHIARILAVIFGVLILLSGLVYAAWVAYLASVCSTFVGFDPYCGGAVLAALLPAIWLVIGGVVALLVYMQMKSIEQKVDAHQFEAAKSQTLIWMVLGFIFGILLGIVLLIAYIKFDPVITWSRSQAGGMAPMGAAVAPPMPPPPVGVVPGGAAGTGPAAGQKFCTSCGAANAPGARFCAKCGAPLPA
jgi:hypothetical protein